LSFHIKIDTFLFAAKKDARHRIVDVTKNIIEIFQGTGTLLRHTLYCCTTLLRHEHTHLADLAVVLLADLWCNTHLADAP
jgi:hypothetical protein